MEALQHHRPHQKQQQRLTLGAGAADKTSRSSGSKWWRCNRPGSTWENSLSGARSQSVAAASKVADRATATAAGECPDCPGHREVCLKLLGRLAGQLGLKQPCGPGELRRTTCRRLLSGSAADTHLAWCRYLLEAYKRLRQDRDDLAAKVAAQSRQTAKLEARVQHGDRDLAEARQQLQRLRAAAAAASQPRTGHRQQQQRVRQSVRSPPTTAPQPSKQDLQKQLDHWDDSRQQQQLDQQPLQRWDSGQSLSCASTSYQPPKTLGSTRIPLPVWYKSPSSATQSTADAVDSDWSDTTRAAERFQQQPVTQSPSLLQLQHQQPVTQSPSLHQLQHQQPQNQRQSRAETQQSCQPRQKRSRTYDKLVPDLIDKWHQTIGEPDAASAVVQD